MMAIRSAGTAMARANAACAGSQSCNPDSVIPCGTAGAAAAVAPAGARGLAAPAAVLAGPAQVWLTFPVTTARLGLTRQQILAFRRRTGALDERLPPGPDSLRRAAWAGLQDSMPRAALLSIHARVAGTEPMTWEDPSLVQLWGPRFNAYVVAVQDLAVFSLGRIPDEAGPRKVAEDL